MVTVPRVDLVSAKLRRKCFGWVTLGCVGWHLVSNLYQKGGTLTNEPPALDKIVIPCRPVG